MNNTQPIKIGPFVSKITDAWISGSFKDMPIQLEDSFLLDMGILREDEYEAESGKLDDQTHYLTWSISIFPRSEFRVPGVDSKINIENLKSSIVFKYYEPDDTEKEYKWDGEFVLSEWDIDIENVGWDSGGSVEISSIEIDFSNRTITIAS
jgi:hypothetical protein